MTTEEFIIGLFCRVDDQMGSISKHPQAKLYPSELVTIGLLFALKGGYFRSFYGWLQRDFATLFRGLPERSRLHRALQVHQGWCQYFLASPTLFTVIDSYGIELLHPAREARSRQPLGKKGKSNRRWMAASVRAEVDETFSRRERSIGARERTQERSCASHGELWTRRARGVCESGLRARRTRNLRVLLLTRSTLDGVRASEIRSSRRPPRARSTGTRLVLRSRGASRVPWRKGVPPASGDGPAA